MAWSRFLKGGRGWKNTAKAEKLNAQAPNELKSPDQVPPVHLEMCCLLWHAQREPHSISAVCDALSCMARRCGRSAGRRPNCRSGSLGAGARSPRAAMHWQSAARGLQGGRLVQGTAARQGVRRALQQYVDVWAYAAAGHAGRPTAGAAKRADSTACCSSMLRLM